MSGNKMLQLALEAGANFETILEDISRHYRPSDPVEHQLVRKIARCIQRLCLSEAVERRVTERDWGSLHLGKSYDRLLKYERLVDIHLHRAITAL